MPSSSLSNLLLFAAAAIVAVTRQGADAVSCMAPVVTTTSSTDTTCGSAVRHSWPVTGNPADCHGWVSQDGSHVNSANNIRCAADGRTLLYTQYAGSSSCGGTSGVDKEFTPECRQGIPPAIYDRLTDASCASPPMGEPSTSQPGVTIYLNGQVCDAAADTAADTAAATNGGTSNGIDGTAATGTTTTGGFGGGGRTTTPGGFGATTATTDATTTGGFAGGRRGSQTPSSADGITAAGGRGAGFGATTTTDTATAPGATTATGATATGGQRLYWWSTWRSKNGPDRR
jgi:hypothetical protein